jgi:Tat protein translocase TatB subunit
MGIGNIGWTEFLVILAIALIFFGPRRLPGIAQAIGKSLREFQKALNEVKSEIAEASRDADTRQEVRRILPRPAEILAGEPSSPPKSKPEPAPPLPEDASGATPPDTSPGGREAEAQPGQPQAAGNTAAAAKPQKAGDGEPRDPHVS